MNNESYMTTDNEDLEYELNEYRAKAHKLLVQGLIGFGCGFILFLFTFSIITPSKIMLALIGGVCFIGIPYGWELVNRAVGGWSIWGNIVIVILFFALKLYAALVVGLFAYPISLIYYMVKAKRGKDLAVYSAISIVLFVLVICSLGWASEITKIQQSSNDSETVSTGIVDANNEAETKMPVSVNSFSDYDEDLNEMFQTALTKAQENELEYIDMGWEITQPAQIHGIYFMKAKDSENPHWYMHNAIDVHNAVAVVAGCYIGEGTMIEINQWEMQVWIFPNFTYGAGDALLYEKANIYHESHRSSDLNELMDWLKSEYDDMTFSKLNIP